MDVLARKLSIIERITQIESEDLLEQVDALLNQSATLTQVHQEIIDERLAAHRANPETGSPWEEVKDKIRRSIAS